MSEILVVRPKFDSATEYSFNWCEAVINLLVEYKRSIIDLGEDKATRQNYEAVVEDVDWVIFYDHGTADGLVQQGGEGYVVDSKNVKTLKGKIIYTMACEWGSKGGIEAFKAGARVVWAYNQVFGFTAQEEHLFKQCANAGIEHRIKEGLSWEECLKQAKIEFNKAIREAKLTWTKIWLQWDRDHLVLYSEKSPPESTCWFRRLAIKLFGKKIGWKL